MLREPFDIGKLQQGVIELLSLDLITANEEDVTQDLKITEIGAIVSELPLAPEVGVILMEASERKCTEFLEKSIFL